MQDDHSQPTFNALPPAVAALAVVIFVIEAILAFGARGYIGGPAGIGWRTEAIRDFAFYGPLLAWIIETGNWTPEHLRRFVTYPFIHQGFAHAIFVIVFLLAMGKLVGEVLGNLAVLVLFFCCGAFGALIFAGLTSDEFPLIGGFPSVYGLIGAYTFLLWIGYGATGQSQYRAFTLIGFLLGIQLGFAIIFGGSNDWVADAAGFALGFVLAPALARGAFRGFLDRMRRR